MKLSWNKSSDTLVIRFAPQAEGGTAFGVDVPLPDEVPGWIVVSFTHENQIAKIELINASLLLREEVIDDLASGDPHAVVVFED